MPDFSLLDADATRLAARLRAGEIRSRDLVEASIARIQRVNPVLNAMVEQRFEAARAEADAADRALAEGQPVGPLHGVPVSIKDCLDVAGMRTTGGLRHRKDHVVDRDADAVARLRAAGAIVVAKTNLPALGMCQETDNKLFGRTNNPWDPGRTPGGSSGGEGALVAVGATAFGLGSDIGGSIRFPSHFNGVVGFKSGAEQVSLRGHFPAMEEPVSASMLGIGPLARSVDDAELVYNLIAASPAPAPGAYEVVVPDPHPRYPLGDAVKQALARAREVLGAPGGDLPPAFGELNEIWQLVMAWDGGEASARLAFGDRPVNRVAQYVRERLAGNTDLHEYMLWTLVGMDLFKPTPHQKATLPDRFAIARDANAAYLERRVVVLPVYHRAAPRHRELYDELFSIFKTYTRYLPYVSYVNALGLPSLTVPVAEDARGMPIGLQVVGRVGMERALFEVGRKLEGALRGYRRCARHD